MAAHRSAAITGNRDPDHVLAEIKESRVFGFTIAITTPEQGRGVLYFIKATTSGSGLSITALRRRTSAAEFRAI
jgi:hypothetical protein